LKRTLSILASVATAATMIFLGVASAQDKESPTQDSTTKNFTVRRPVTKTFKNPATLMVGVGGQDLRGRPERLPVRLKVVLSIVGEGGQCCTVRVHGVDLVVSEVAVANKGYLVAVR
jgi:hypothetical protein